MTRDPWKQTNLQIDPPVVNRKCQWGTCDKDYAYWINGVDLCFEHGCAQIDKLREQALFELGIAPATQLPLIKP